MLPLPWFVTTHDTDTACPTDTAAGKAMLAGARSGTCTVTETELVLLALLDSEIWYP